VGTFGEWEFDIDRQATVDAYARAPRGDSAVEISLLPTIKYFHKRL
jgi:hypothetical protein